MSVNRLETLHILYLIDELKVKGGTEKHLFELATGMADAGFRVTVFSLTEGAYAREFKDDARIRYRCLNVTRIYDLKGLSRIIEIAAYIRNHNVDILQTFHTASDLVGPIAARLSLRRIKVISSRRDLGYTKSCRHVKAQRYINRLVDGVLANSRAVKSSIIEQDRYPAGQITVIHNGIYIEPFATDIFSRQEQRALMGVDEYAILIGSVGNIRPVKGYDLLVEAAAQVCQENGRVRFYHVGEGEMRESLEARCVELGIEEHFTFLGASSNVASFLAGLDVYVQPSRSEGLSNAILEGMAARLPVVATEVGGNHDLVEHGVTGLLVPAEDSAALAGQLMKLVRDPHQRNVLAERAYKRVINEFQVSSMIDSYVKYYQEILNYDRATKTGC